MFDVLGNNFVALAVDVWGYACIALAGLMLWYYLATTSRSLAKLKNRWASYRERKSREKYDEAYCRGYKYAADLLLRHRSSENIYDRLTAESDRSNALNEDMYSRAFDGGIKQAMDDMTFIATSVSLGDMDHLVENDSDDTPFEGRIRPSAEGTAGVQMYLNGEWRDMVPALPVSSNVVTAAGTARANERERLAEAALRDTQIPGPLVLNREAFMQEGARAESDSIERAPIDAGAARLLRVRKENDHAE